jgi:hypothetical protein
MLSALLTDNTLPVEQKFPRNTRNERLKTEGWFWQCCSAFKFNSRGGQRSSCIQNVTNCPDMGFTYIFFPFVSSNFKANFHSMEVQVRVWAKFG